MVLSLVSHSNLPKSPFSDSSRSQLEEFGIDGEQIIADVL